MTLTSLYRPDHLVALSYGDGEVTVAVNGKDEDGSTTRHSTLCLTSAQAVGLARDLLVSAELAGGPHASPEVGAPPEVVRVTAGLYTVGPYTIANHPRCYPRSWVVSESGHWKGEARTLAAAVSLAGDLLAGRLVDR